MRMLTARECLEQAELHEASAARASGQFKLSYLQLAQQWRFLAESALQLERKRMILKMHGDDDEGLD